MLICEFMSILLNIVTIVRPCIYRIAIIIHPFLFTKRLWKVLFTLGILYASIWTAGTIEHEV